MIRSTIRPVLLYAALASTVLAGCDARLQQSVAPLTEKSLPERTASVAAPGEVPGPPTVQILAPEPGAIFTPVVTTPVTVSWTGDDPDGRIVEYRYKVIAPRLAELPNAADAVSYFYSDPSQLEVVFGPDFESWTAVKPNVTSATISLYPTQMYLFAITAIDDQGEHTGFTITTNVLRFAVRADGGPGPFITVDPPFGPNEIPIPVTFTNGGSYVNDPGLYFRVEAFSSIPLLFTWSAVAQGDAQVVGFRWGLDLTNLELGSYQGSGNAPRRWSPQSLDNTSATIGPFALGETHHLFIEAEDSLGNKSLIVIEIDVTTVPPWLNP